MRIAGEFGVCIQKHLSTHSSRALGDSSIFSSDRRHRPNSHYSQRPLYTHTQTCARNCAHRPTEEQWEMISLLKRFSSLYRREKCLLPGERGDCSRPGKSSFIWTVDVGLNRNAVNALFGIPAARTTPPPREKSSKTPDVFRADARWKPFISAGHIFTCNIYMYSTNPKFRPRPRV